MKSFSLLVVLVSSSLFLNACGGGAPLQPPPPAATHLSVTTSAAPVAGMPFNVSVSALDASNGVVSTYSGTVHIMSTDIQAVLPPDAKLTGGMGSFSVTFKTSGAQTVSVADAAGVLTTGNSSSIKVNPGAATQFAVSAPASAGIGTAFNFTVTAQDASKNTATGYTGTIHFTSSDVQAILPANSPLTNGTGTAIFSATLKTAGSQTITATDIAAASITGPSNSINVATITITSGLLPNATAQIAYGTLHQVRVPGTGQFLQAVFFQLAGTGGLGAYSWSWAAAPGSSLPPGLTCCFLRVGGGRRSPSVSLYDVVSGVPTTVGAYNVVVSVRDSATPPALARANYIINIAPAPLRIAPGTLPAGTVGAAYAGSRSGFALGATGGVTPYTWSWVPAAGSSLPPGLNLSNGSISGIPTTPGTYNVAVTVTDSQSPAVHTSANYSITIAPPVINTTPAPAIGTLNVPYVGFTFTATGGFPPLTWNESHVLPPGLVFSNGGALSGKPTVAGSYPITVMMRDSLGNNAAPQDFTIQVLPTGFAPTGSMGTARQFHTATLLCDLSSLPCNNKKVLITGGIIQSADLATAELFDSTSGTFAPTGSMHTLRHKHTATLLHNGKVLVTGGRDGANSVVATAELFDPASGTFAPTGSMLTVRESHTATLLNDGRVLVTGGLDATGVGLATAELFDPTTGSFSPTGTMGTARWVHTATLLNSGKVLVVGGSSAELFDPATGLFTPTGNMATALFLHAATLLNDGRVLVTGGFDGGNNAFATAELFDPASGTFAPTGNMQTARVYHTATLLGNGTVLVTGGDHTVPLSLSQSAAEVFDPATGAFTATADMTTARESHRATLLANGQVLVTGGRDTAGPSTTILAAAELYH